MYIVYHGSWRDFGTAVGAIVCAEMNTIFGATFVGRWFVEVFCSLRSHGTRDEAGSIIDRCCRERLAWKCSVRFAHTAHASLMGAYAPKRSANRALSREGWIALSGDDKLTTANLCDRKKNRRCGRERCYDSSMSLRNSRLVLRRLYFVSPITPCPV